MTDVVLYATGWVAQLPAINALLNLAATILLVLGYCLIKAGREQVHKTTMITAFATSVIFLACYLIYHQQVGHVPFSGPAPVRQFYLAMLATHVVLAALVPVLAVVTIYFGLKDRRSAHRRFGALDVSDLVVRFHHRCSNLRDGLSSLSLNIRDG